MAENSKIEWCDNTFNPWEGCQKVGPGCDHCYAEARNARYNGTAVNWGPGAPRRRTSAANWNKPLKWNREAFNVAKANGGRKQRVFCSSLADVFDNAVDPQWRSDLFALINATPNLDWLLLTKRIGNVEGMLAEIGMTHLPVHVWLGATVVNQAEADRDIPKLLASPATIRFLSMEPLLGPVDLREVCNGHYFQNPLTGHRWHDAPVGVASASDMNGPKLDWVIVGGESGPGARPMHPDWARSLRDQCAAAGVPFFFKQWGEWRPTSSAAIHRAEGRDHPTSPGLSWLKDGRICLRDFTVAEHRRRIKAGVATCARAVEVEHAALTDFHGTLNLADGPINPLGYQWMYRTGKKEAGRLLDGRTHDGYPA